MTARFLTADCDPAAAAILLYSRIPFAWREAARHADLPTTKLLLLLLLLASSNELRRNAVLDEVPTMKEAMLQYCNCDAAERESG